MLAQIITSARPYVFVGKPSFSLARIFVVFIVCQITCAAIIICFFGVHKLLYYDIYFIAQFVEQLKFFFKGCLHDDVCLGEIYVSF